MGITDTNYVNAEFAIMAVLAEIVYTLRTPYHYLSNAANRFKETRTAAYGEAVINILFSVALVFKFGIIGVAAATLAATAFRSVFYAVYISKHILQRRIFAYIKRNIIYGLAFTAIFIAGGWTVSLVGTENYLKWTICGLLVFALSLIISLLTNMMFYRGDILAILSRTRIGKSVIS